jgi:branched-chain amino acid transport system substrate-binding protein
LQVVAVPNPDPAEVESGAVFELRPGNFARLQQVIYSGIYVNELMWLDPSRFTFGADFYIWLRFARNSGPGASDPADIKFPEMAPGAFSRDHPVEKREMADGTNYLLWRVQGEFRNNFDLHRYPFDVQALAIRFFNARASANRIVYAVDLWGAPDLTDDLDKREAPAGASKEAFRRLSQWSVGNSHQMREVFLARSSLGDPLRVGRENYRELSGYVAAIELRRRAFTTLMKNLLPLLLMTCIMYASLHFPPVLVQPKVAVAMTAVLTGMVLLNLVNAQLGSIGYTVAVEYAFYIYFALGLLSIVSVLYSEHQRAIGRPVIADRCDLGTRVIFVTAVAGLCLGAVLYA